MDDDKAHLEKPVTYFERTVLEKLVFSAVTEQRRARRWKIFFLFLLFIYLFAVLFIVVNRYDHAAVQGNGKHTALVDLKGVISASSGVGADEIVGALQEAFENKNTAGVILRINSPGGSPTQSSYIYKEMKRLRGLYPDIPLYGVIADIGASGGYYVALGADKIYANESSIIGSIGVTMNGFGFTQAINKLGIERRLLTAGENKALFDPFSPLSDDKKAHIQMMLDSIHGQFIEVVKESRGDQLTSRAQVFSGLVWTGTHAKNLGLIDDFGSAGYVAREVVKAKNIVNFTHKGDLIERLSDRLGRVLSTYLLDWNGLL